MTRRTERTIESTLAVLVALLSPLFGAIVDRTVWHVLWQVGSSWRSWHLLMLKAAELSGIAVMLACLVVAFVVWDGRDDE